VARRGVIAGGAVGTVERRHDGKVGSEIGFFDIPSQEETEIEAVVGLRRLLAAAGFSEDGAPN
jgi:hypothetical protein